MSAAKLVEVSGTTAASRAGQKRNAPLDFTAKIEPFDLLDGRKGCCCKEDWASAIEYKPCRKLRRQSRALQQRWFAELPSRKLPMASVLPSRAKLRYRHPISSAWSLPCQIARPLRSSARLTILFPSR